MICSPTCQPGMAGLPAHPASTLAVTVQSKSVWAEAAVEVTAPRASARACAAVTESMSAVSASVGSGAPPQVIGVASSATRAEELAER